MQLLASMRTSACEVGARIVAMLRAGMICSDSLTRKRARQALSELLDADAAAPQHSPPRPNAALPTKDPTKDLTKYRTKDRAKDTAEPTNQLPSDAALRHAAWRALLSLYDTMDAYAAHLQQATWREQLPVLLQGLAAPAPPPGAEWSALNVRWACMLLQTGLTHENTLVRRFVASVLLTCAPPQGDLPPLPLDWVAAHLFPALCESGNVPGALAALSEVLLPACHMHNGHA